jgi:hypothetical protein
MLESSRVLIAAALLITAGCSDGGTGSDRAEHRTTTNATQATRSYSLYTHCGIEWAQIDGVWWQSSTPRSDGNGNPPAGWGNPFQQGTLTFVDRSTAKFASSAGDVVFRRTLRTEPPQICS